MLDERSKYLRRLIIEQMTVSRRGHLGSALSIVEVLRVLYDDFMNFRPDNIDWIKRDRFILSKGHGCMALYAVLADKGFFELEQLKSFCCEKSILGGHPEANKVPGVEASTGSLGHGLSIGIGICVALKIKKMNNKVCVLLGDGELNEGSVWEAFLSASKHKLSKLFVLIDYNKLQSAGTTSNILELEPLSEKLLSFGFEVSEVDGHNPKEILKKLSTKKKFPNKPNVLICHTVKGRGIPFSEHNLNYHHKNNVSDEEILEMKECLS